MPANKTRQLVTLEVLEGIIASAKADPEKQVEPSHELYLKSRWADMVMWWHTRAEGARWKYMLLRAIVVVGGVLIPVLSTISMNASYHEIGMIATAAIGAVVAAAAAWEGVANYGEIWREKRRAAELLKVEGWQFLQLSGKYQTDGTLKVAFPRFVNEVETMIASEVGEYLKTFDPSLASAREGAAEILGAIIAEAKRRIGNS